MSNCLHSNCRFLLFYTQIVADFGFDLPKVVSSVNQCELMSTSIDHKIDLHIDSIYIYMIYITFQYLKLVYHSDLSWTLEYPQLPQVGDHDLAEVDAVWCKWTPPEMLGEATDQSLGDVENSDQKISNC